LCDQPGEQPLDTGRRELAEETGLEAALWSTLVDLRPSAGMSTEVCRVYQAAADPLRLHPAEYRAATTDLWASRLISRSPWLPATASIAAFTDRGSCRRWRKRLPCADGVGHQLLSPRQVPAGGLPVIQSGRCEHVRPERVRADDGDGAGPRHGPGGVPAM
jgi:8-oxo-dGTP pyrophosphatase MutT (NUDIX family)